jgi:hypothetical protein
MRSIAATSTWRLRRCANASPSYNGEGNAAPASLAYYGGGKWHRHRIGAQSTLEPYVFEGERCKADYLSESDDRCLQTAD